jgi:hypothetical protein
MGTSDDWPAQLPLGNPRGAQGVRGAPRLVAEGGGTNGPEREREARSSFGDDRLGDGSHASGAGNVRAWPTQLWR